MWLYLPKQFVPSLAELEDSTNQSDWQPQAVKLWFMSSGKAMQSPLSAKRWKTRSWMKLLFGTTLHPSMASLGVERYRQSLEDFHVPTCPSQAKKKESSKETDPGFSTNTSALLAKYDPDTSSWRTSQACWITGQWAMFSENFPKSGCLVNGECFQRREWEAPISAKEFLLWGTPNTMDILPAGISGAYRESLGSRRERSSNLRDQVVDKAWPTPRALEIEESVESHNARMEKRKAEGKEPISENLSLTTKKWRTPLGADGTLNHGLAPSVLEGQTTLTLSAQVLKEEDSKKWPTPVKSDFQERRASENWDGSDLPSVVDAWPTPTVNMVKGHNKEESLVFKDGKGKVCKRLSRLDNAAVHTGPGAKWLTPAAREDAACPQSQRMLTHQAKEFESCESPIGPQDQMKESIGKQSLPNDPTLPQRWATPVTLDQVAGRDVANQEKIRSTLTNADLSRKMMGETPKEKKRLNPRFVEWLMGHPIGWSSVKKIEMKDYNAWVTESSRLLELLLSGSCGKGW